MSHPHIQPVLPTRKASGPKKSRPGPSRRGFSLLEFEIALIVLSIALTGLFPLIIMNSRALEKLESRYPFSEECYLTPSSDPWAEKLGASALLTETPPDPKPQPPVLDIDDGDDGYEHSGSEWVSEADTSSVGEDRTRHPAPPESTPPTGTEIASWTFTDVPPGWYNIEATWSPAEDQTETAQFAAFENETSLGEIPTVNQKNAPDGYESEGRWWKILLTPFIRSGTVRVELDGQAAEGYVVADAVRLVPVENNVQIQSIEKTLTAEETTVHVTVEVKVPQ